MPKYSVIIPNYNHSKFLKKRIDSVVNQTYRDFEVIILDDNSKDDSVRIINSYKQNEKISHIIINTVNSGSTFKQWEKGFNLCKGKFIWIAESDDIADLNFLSEFDKYLSKNDDIKLAFCLSNIINENDIISHIQEPYGDADMIYEGKEFVEKHMLRKNPIINASAVIFRKDCLPDSLDYTKFKFCGDWYFYSIIINKGKVLILNKALNFFRMHSNKVTPLSLTRGIGYTEGVLVISSIFKLYRISAIKKIITKILFISDLHLDIFVEENYKKESLKVINKYWSRLILLLGSIMSKIRLLKRVLK